MQCEEWCWDSGRGAESRKQKEGRGGKGAVPETNPAKERRQRLPEGRPGNDLRAGGE
jgi:hypothetical protein